MSQSFDFTRLPKEILDKILTKLALIDYDGIEELGKSFPPIKNSCQHFKLNYLGPVKYSRPIKTGGAYYDESPEDGW